MIGCMTAKRLGRNPATALALCVADRRAALAVALHCAAAVGSAQIAGSFGEVDTVGTFGPSHLRPIQLLQVATMRAAHIEIPLVALIEGLFDPAAALDRRRADFQQKPLIAEGRRPLLQQADRVALIGPVIAVRLIADDKRR